MRKKDREITDPAILKSIMLKAQVCRVGLSLNDVPYVVPVNFGFKDNRIYFHSSLKGMKIDILRQNSNVCFEMECDVEVVHAEAACDWTAKFLSIIGFGKAHIVEDFSEKLEGLAIIMEHYSPSLSYEFPEEKVNKAAIIRIDIESMTGKKLGY
ncbi:MAG: pyridoxamine 5'-phosphate oxidase family protein [Desulfomonile tiedjei]|nr:pyridoxamine 5'-phosphate oxidase family protein [Desulfomonile tiedjei]